jgi:methionine-rich copper-binding protein CopC
VHPPTCHACSVAVVALAEANPQVAWAHAAVTAATGAAGHTIRSLSYRLSTLSAC